MSTKKADIKALTEKLDFPQEAIDTLCACADRLQDNKEFCKLVSRFERKPNKLDDVLKDLKAFADKMGENEYTLDMYLLLSACGKLHKRYKRKGISDEIYYKTLEDLKWKLLECYECEEVWGTFVAGWYRGFFVMNRFGLGRLQFEKSRFGEKRYEKNGLVLRKGSRVIGFHIPSAGPLTKESRIDAYKRAYKFYGGKNGKPMAFVCGSWLLYPPHREFLPEGSNILDFMDDFDIIKYEDKKDFHDGWRVFGKYSDAPLDQLPENTSLQRAFAKRLREGKPTGSGYGVFFFDGEKIL